MSSHSYRTTTVEYYEYVMPANDVNNYESMTWPFHAPIPANYVASPFGCINCLTDLPGHMAMHGGDNQQRQLIYDMVPCHPRQTIIEYTEEEEPHSSHSVPNRVYEEVQNEAHMYKDFDYKAEDGSGSRASSSEPKRKKKNVYRADQGYLVEEPTSESSEDGQEEERTS